MEFWNWLNFAKNSLKRVCLTYTRTHFWKPGYECISLIIPEKKIFLFFSKIGLQNYSIDSNLVRKYIDLNEKIEHTSKWVHFAMVKLTVTSFKVPESTTSLVKLLHLWFGWWIICEHSAHVIVWCKLQKYINTFCFRCICFPGYHSILKCHSGT